MSLPLRDDIPYTRHKHAFTHVAAFVDGGTPVIFIGHGSPMNAILDNDFTRALIAWGKSLPKPQVISVVSANWLTTGTFVTCMNQLRTIHDFYGCPSKHYTLENGKLFSPYRVPRSKDS